MPTTPETAEMTCEKCGAPKREECNGALINGILCRQYIAMLRRVVPKP